MDKKKRITKSNRKCILLKDTIAVSIPKQICESMDIEKGTVLLCSVDGNKIIYEKDNNTYAHPYRNVSEIERKARVDLITREVGLLLDMLDELGGNDEDKENNNVE